MKLPALATQRNRRRLMGILSVIGLVAVAATSPDFVLIPKSVVIPERGPVPGYVLIAGSNRFSFLYPPDWRVGANAVDRKVTMQSRDFSAAITVRVLPSPVAGVATLDPAEMRDRVTNGYPGSRITREFQLFSANQRGPAFDLVRVVKTNTVAMRVVFVPFDGGILEFGMTAMPAKFTNCNLPFGTVLTSFRVEPRTVNGPPRGP